MAETKVKDIEASLSNYHSRAEAKNYTLGVEILSEQVNLPAAGQATLNKAGYVLGGVVEEG